MKNKYILVSTIFILFSLALHCQEKVVSYTTQKRTLFSIPENTDIKKITDLDLARMEVKDKYESKETIISKDLEMEIIITDLTKYNNLSDYKFGIETRILNSYGVELYNFDGKLVYSKAHEDPEEAEFYILSEEVYKDYGFSNNLFEFDPAEILNMLYKENLTLEYKEGEYLKAYGDSVQFHIDFENLFYETMLFEDRELKYIDYKFYIRDRNFITPYKESLSYFENSINGIRIMRTEESTYLEYAVVEDQKPLYERFEKPYDKSRDINLFQYAEAEVQYTYMKVFPNPAYDKITVEIPFIDEENINIEIYDIYGNILLTKNITDASAAIDISGFKSGSYIVNCKSAAHPQSVMFIKN